MTMTASVGTDTQERLGRLAAAVAEGLAVDGRVAGPATPQESPSQLVVDDEVAGVWSQLPGDVVVCVVAAVAHLPEGTAADESALVAHLGPALTAGVAGAGWEPAEVLPFVGLDTLAGVFANVGGDPVVVGSGVFLGDVVVASVGVLVPEGSVLTSASVAGPTSNGETPSGGLNLALIADVELEVSAELGSTTLPMAELLALQPGSVVELDRPQGAPVDVLVNGTLIARGEVIVVDESYAIRVTEVVSERNDR